MNAQTKFDSVDFIAANPPAIGMPCDRPGGGLAYVVAVEAATGATYTLFGGPSPMARDRFRLTIASDEGTISEVSENIAAPMIYRARHLPAIGEAEAAALWERAKLAQERMRREAAAERAAAEARREQAARDLVKVAPAWAQAAIVAELHRDQSDSMTDYYGSTTTRRVVIGWSRHKRDLFPEMRKAAATFPETADLATAPASAEHREKYSMGGGYYLKNGWRHSDGWQISKSPINWLSLSELEFSDAVRGIAAPTDEPAPPITAGGNAAGLFTIERHTHSKKGFAMWICTLAERIERADFDRFLADAKALGGWYSRAWAGTPAGFAFKSEDKALAFVGANPPAPPSGPTDEPRAEPRAARSAPISGAGTAEKLRAMADAMQPAIDEKNRDRRANTPKQQRQAAEARQEARDLERGQKIMQALADRHDAGTVPACLARVTTKAAILQLAREEIDRSRAGYYDAGFPTGKPYQWREGDKAEQAAAAWALLDTAGEIEARAQEELRQKIESLKFAKIPGYFPTPAALVARMIEAADLEPGARVLEPSAGSGAIADAARDAGHNVFCVERHATLAAILASKGHEVRQSDFMEYPARGGFYDAVLMNPPFEAGQDCAHVRHAWKFLKPGGALVAIMGVGVTFRQQRPYSDFREWSESLGGEFVEIPAGTFKESGTGVASVMLTLRKGE